MKNIEKIILDNLKDPVVFVDTGHIIRYTNRVAMEHYENGENLVGTSIFDCHNETSNKIIKEVFKKMEAGLCEEKITDNQKYRVYMRAVRDENKNIIGYMERFEPAVGK